MKTLMKTVALTTVLIAGTATASDMTKGVGTTLWYSNNCEELSDKAFDMTSTVLISEGVNPFSTEGLMDDDDLVKGYKIAEKSGCSSVKKLLIKTGTYNILYK